MLTRRLIPSMLLKQGRLVKGVRFRDHRDAGYPPTTARAHSHQGADELILLDIDASKTGQEPDFKTVREVASECSMPVTFGGGVRSIEDARACMDAGIDKICLTTTALDDPALITRLAQIFGSQAVVLGVDVADGSCLYDHRSDSTIADPRPIDWIREGVDRGAGEIRLMAVNREGSRSGMELDLLVEVLDAVSVPVILEGGAGTLEHLEEALHAGADGVAVGTMLVFSDNNLVKVKRHLAGSDCDMRL
tara:strand:- start:326 stop:1072 length:747 start_codon:yes stop_codon:yes gene_type:complete